MILPMSGETTLTSAKIPCWNFLNNRQTARSHARLVGRSFGTNQHMQLWLVCFFSSVFLACQAPSLSMRNVWNSFFENSLGAWTKDRRYGKSTKYIYFYHGNWHYHVVQQQKIAPTLGTCSAYDANLDSHTWFRFLMVPCPPHAQQRLFSQAARTLTCVAKKVEALEFV